MTPEGKQMAMAADTSKKKNVNLVVQEDVPQLQQDFTTAMPNCGRCSLEGPSKFSAIRRSLAVPPMRC